MRRNRLPKVVIFSSTCVIMQSYGEGGVEGFLVAGAGDPKMV
jgi:hypothetical protein